MPNRFPKTEEILRDAGYKIQKIGNTEAGKLDGGLRHPKLADRIFTRQVGSEHRSPEFDPADRGCFGDPLQDGAECYSKHDSGFVLARYLAAFLDQSEHRVFQAPW